MKYKYMYYANNIINGYNDVKYWNMRLDLQNNKKLSKLRKYFYLFRLRKMEGKNGASLGLRLSGGGSLFSGKASAAPRIKRYIYCA